MHRPNRALGDQVFRQRIGGQKAPLMGNRQLNATAPTGNQHLFGRAQRIRHWLLTEDRLGAMRGRGNCPRCMAAMPGADRNHVELFFFEHLSRVGVMISGERKAAVHIDHRAFVEVGERHDRVAAGDEIAVDMVATHTAAAENTHT